jgi:hypothetical protein
VHVAEVPLNFTTVAPCDAPNVNPVITTFVPIGPLVTESEVMVGVTVNDKLLDGFPPTVAMMLPVTAPVGTGQTTLTEVQEVGMQFVPPKLRLLDPCVAPRPVPEAVTLVPTGPLA